MEAKSSLAQKVVLMSLFSWFARKPPPSTRALSSGLSRSDETRPLGRGQSIPGAPKATISADPKKNARYMRRELLYAIVRESMVRFGVLSAGYKFKALALDPRGLKFMVMVDLAMEFGGQSERLSEIEVLIAQNAKARHGILVSAVYWRLNEHVAVGSVSPGAAAPAVVGTVGMESADEFITGPEHENAAKPSYGKVSHQQIATLASQPMPLFPMDGPTNDESSEYVDVFRRGVQYDPIARDEVAAFKRALSAGATPASGPTSWPLATKKPPKAELPSYAFLTGFEDTEAVDPDFTPPALGTTQYGELH